jgi:hypothetical protein
VKTKPSDDEPERPKLTRAEQKMLAELDEVRALVANGEDAQDIAKDEGYRLARRYFDRKRDEYKPRFKKLLDKLGFRTRARGNNKLLRLAEYLSGGKVRGAAKTRFAQSLAACVFYGAKWTALKAQYEGKDGRVIRAWREDAGLVKPPPTEPPQNTPVVIDGDLPDDSLHDGKTYIATFTLISRSDMSLHLHAYIDAADPRVASIVKELQELARETADA